MASWTSLLLQLSFYFNGLYSFNLDTHVPVVKEGKKDSYFGYSVAEHLKTQSRKAAFLIGAPKANITQTSENYLVRGLTSPGTAFQCPLTPKINDCQEVFLQLYRKEETEWDQKDLANMWLGVTVVSAGTSNGKAMVCAHRMRNFAKQGGVIHNEWANGKCYILDNNLNSDQWDTPVEPCANRGSFVGGRLIKTYAYCQSGMSGFMSEDNVAVIGTPGPFTWTGMATVKQLFNESNIFLQLYEAHSQPETKKTVPPPVLPYSYLGMSSSMGNILDDKTVVSGATRSQNVGQVVLFKETTLPDRKRFLVPDSDSAYLSGDQLGSMFGHATAPVDLNGDGADDLVVAAPFYREEGVGGAIYVYINSAWGINNETIPIKIVSPKIPTSECAKMNCEDRRFGYAVVNAGDLNLDGYEDLAVSAPYEGNGAVYIYHGTHDGINTDPVQKILADDLLTARPLKSFGFSLSGKVDMDNNGYPDLMVGAYESSKVLLLRTRPVINIISRFTATGGVPIDLSTTPCTKEGIKYTCFTVRVCLKYTAKPTRNFQERLDVMYTIEADFMKKAPRVTFEQKHKSSSRTRTIKVLEQSRDEFECRDDTLLVKNDLQDKLEPISLKLTVKLKERSPPTMRTSDTVVPNINAYPILNEESKSQTLKVEFTKKCGPDKICQSDLSVIGRFRDLPINKRDRPVLDVNRLSELEDDRLPLFIEVKNKIEEAHLATLRVKLPSMLTYRDTNEEGKKYSCEYADNFVNCSMGNPLKKNDDCGFDMLLKPVNLTPKDKDLIIELSVDTISEEREPSDNKFIIELKVVIKTDIELFGKSKDVNVYFGGEIKGESAMQTVEDIGPPVMHEYTVLNSGVAPVTNVSVVIDWPYELEMGEVKGRHVLYMVQPPHIDGGGICFFNESNSYINVLNLKTKKSVEVNITSEAGPEYKSKSRKKRLAAPPPKETEDPDTKKKVLVTDLNCNDGTAKCFRFRCQIGILNADKTVKIQIYARLWSSTFLMHYTSVDYVAIRSQGEIKLDTRFHIEQNSTKNDKAVILTKAIPDVLVAEAPGVPLWVIIVASCAGIVLLIVIVILLWACGFFKRDRPEYQGNIQKKKSYYDDDDAY